MTREKQIAALEEALIHIWNIDPDNEQARVAHLALMRSRATTPSVCVADDEPKADDWTNDHSRAQAWLNEHVSRGHAMGPAVDALVVLLRELRTEGIELGAATPCGHEQRSETLRADGCEPTRCEHDMAEQWRAACEAAATVAERVPLANRGPASVRAEIVDRIRNLAKRDGAPETGSEAREMTDEEYYAFAARVGGRAPKRSNG